MSIRMIVRLISQRLVNGELAFQSVELGGHLWCILLTAGEKHLTRRGASEFSLSIDKDIRLART